MKMIDIANAILERLQIQQGMKHQLDTVAQRYNSPSTEPLSEVRFRAEDGTLFLFTPDLEIYIGARGKSWTKLSMDEISAMPDQVGESLGLNLAYPAWAKIYNDYNPNTILLGTEY
jgi:hypothetical protein